MVGPPESLPTYRLLEVTMAVAMMVVVVVENIR